MVREDGKRRIVRKADRAIGFCLAVLGLSACAPEPKLPDVDLIYNRVTAAGGLDRRPLITIPGTLGSRLVDGKTGTVIWGGGASRGLSADPESPEEARLIALPILPAEAPFSELRDDVRPAGVLDTATPEVLGIPISIDVYGGVQRTLNAGGFISEMRKLRVLGRAGPSEDRDQVDGDPETPAKTPAGKEPGPTLEQYGEIAEDSSNAFRFDYDWRRDIPSIAQEFHRYVMTRKRKVAALRSLREGRTVNPEDVSFDLLAHSMGGLVARYYLMHGPAPLGESGELPPITWEGAEHFNRVVIVAAPNAGSILAADNLINGKEIGPLQPFYPAALLNTHASPWQLFPRARHGRAYPAGSPAETTDLLDPAIWERNSWGLLAPEAEPLLSWLLPDIEDPAQRRALARAHQARLIRRAKRFQAAMDRPWIPAKPAHLEMFLVVGGGFSTPATAEIDPDTGAFQLTGEEEGDGVVLRTSVLLDERQGGAYDRGLDTPLRFDTTLFLPDEHVELTKNPVFGDNLLFWLLEQPRPERELATPETGSMLAIAPKPAANLAETIAPPPVDR